MEMESKSPHLDTPIRWEDDRTELITITDPTHPLHGRSFALMSASSSAGSGRQILVVYRDGVLIRVPAAATSLLPSAADRPSSKLSIEAVRDLIHFARQSRQRERAPSDNLINHESLEHDSESDLANSPGSIRGEP